MRTSLTTGRVYEGFDLVLKKERLDSARADPAALESKVEDFDDDEKKDFEPDEKLREGLAAGLDDELPDEKLREGLDEGLEDELPDEKLRDGVLRLPDEKLRDELPELELLPPDEKLRPPEDELLASMVVPPNIRPTKSRLSKSFLMALPHH